MTDSAISSELLILLHPRVRCWYVHHHKYVSVLLKYWITVFKVKVTAKVQNCIECLPVHVVCVFVLFVF